MREVLTLHSYTPQRWPLPQNSGTHLGGCTRVVCLQQAPGQSFTDGNLPSLLSELHSIAVIFAHLGAAQWSLHGMLYCVERPAAMAAAMGGSASSAACPPRAASMVLLQAIMIAMITMACLHSFCKRARAQREPLRGWADISSQRACTPRVDGHIRDENQALSLSGTVCTQFVPVPCLFRRRPSYCSFCLHVCLWISGQGGNTPSWAGSESDKLSSANRLSSIETGGQTCGFS